MKPADSGNKSAPQQAVQQNDSKKLDKPKDQEEDKQEFNVGNVCLFVVMNQCEQNLIYLIYKMSFLAEGAQQADFRFGQKQWLLQLQCE